MNSHPPTLIGQARAVLVFGKGETAQAVTTSICARVIEGPGPPSIRFTGPVRFDETSSKHLPEVVLSTVARILAIVGIRCPEFEVSIANLGATASQDLGCRITGFSADIPVFLALLSAGLGLPIRQDLMATGHLATVSGIIRMVMGLPAKLNAALADPFITTFLHPAFDSDPSIGTLAPGEKLRIENALRQVSDHLQVHQISNVEDLLERTFIESDWILTSLRKKYFRISPVSDAPGEMDGVNAIMVSDLEKRFWKCLEESLFEANSELVTTLLQERVLFEQQQGAYPAGFGRKLFQLLQSLPPSLRRTQTRFPLIVSELAAGFIQLASGDDLPDVRLFLDSNAGDRFGVHQVKGNEDTPILRPGAIPETVKQFLASIETETVNRVVGIPIDTARATYSLPSCAVESKEEFMEMIVSFYIHLLRHNSMTVEPVNRQAAEADAINLLESAFRRLGGIKAAQKEAMEPIRGGMRFVLDVMTSHYRQEEQRKYKNLLFKQALSSLEEEESLSFMRGLLDYLKPFLPPELKDPQPERFLEFAEDIFEAYVRSLDEMREPFRRF